MSADGSVDVIPTQSGYLGQPMELPGILALSGYFATLAVSGAHLLLACWPDGSPQIALLGGWMRWEASGDLRLALVAQTAGLLGAFVHAATSFATYVGNRQLIRSWALWYVLRPFIGMTLALVVYFVLRGGFMSPQAETSSISPYGVAALAALAGMFSKQTADKLKDVFENAFPSREDARRVDKLAPDQG
jgi:hypothetical protein